MKRAALSIAWIAAVLALLALGTWQVERRTWKLDLIARVEAGMRAAPIEAPATAGPGDAYRRVVATGWFLPGQDSFVQASTIRGPGWWVLTPLRTDGGRTILINRGYVPDRIAPPPCTPAKAGVQAGPPPSRGYNDARATSRCTVTGLLRLTEPGGGFLRSNDPPADRWYSRDVAAIAAKRGLTTVPYFIDADASADTPGQPDGGLTVVRFANNHLVYAITWYVLAMMMFAGFLYWRRVSRTGDAA